VVEQNEFKPAQHEPDGRTKRVKLTVRPRADAPQVVAANGEILYQENCSENSGYNGEYWRFPTANTRFEIGTPTLDTSHVCKSPTDLTGYTRFARESFKPVLIEPGKWPNSQQPNYNITGNIAGAPKGFALISNELLWFLFPGAAIDARYALLRKAAGGRSIWLNGERIYTLDPITGAVLPSLNGWYVCVQPKV
jgi:hypothetical protein